MTVRIVDTEGKEVSQASVIGKYFRQPDEKLQDFMAGMKALTPADKEELAIGAAKELGYLVHQS